LGKILKIGQKLGIRDPAGGGFTSTPRAGAPRFPGGSGRGVWSPAWAGESPGASREVLFGLPGDPGPGRPLRTPAGNRGAPARGVDVKPPPGTPGSGIRTPVPGPCPGSPGGGGSPDPVREVSGSRIPGSGPGSPKRASQAPGAPGGPPAGGCFTSTPRGGAPRFPPGPDPVPEGQEVSDLPP